VEGIAREMFGNVLKKLRIDWIDLRYLRLTRLRDRGMIWRPIRGWFDVVRFHGLNAVVISGRRYAAESVLIELRTGER